MTDDKSFLDEIAADLADGKAVDWEHSKRTDTKNSQLIDQLNSIAKISQAYGAYDMTGNATAPAKKPSALFEWGHLLVLNKLGEGSYGEVYCAYDSVLDREVALKLLKQDKLAPIQSRAFIQEARRLAKVRNRHVLAVHGANIHDSRVGIWSDLIEGVDLAEKQLKDTPVDTKYSVNQMTPLIAAMADALIAVHDAGLIHGDIKPSNVMIDKQQKFTLMDFGAGTELNNDSNQSGYLIGSLLYMAPELFEKNELSPASDIYALGVLLFNLVTGTFPVKGKDLAAIRQAHQVCDYATINRYQNKLPKNLQRLIQQMILPDPHARPTAGQIKAQLNWIVDAPQRRNKRLTIAAIVGLSVMGTLVSSVGFYRANQAQQRAVQEKDKAEVFSEFMKNTLKAPASLGKGKEVRVADLLATAAEEVTIKFADQPHSKAVIFQAIGDSYSSLQLPQEALNYLSQSLVIQQQLHGVKGPETLATAVEVALQNYRLGRSAESKKQYLKAIEIAEIHQVNDIRRLAQIRLATITRDEGNYHQAESLLKQLLVELPADQAPDNNHKFLALLELANNYIDQAKYPQAEALGKQALQWLQVHYANRADANMNAAKSIIAIALSQQGKFAQAEVYFRELMAEAEVLFGKKNRTYVSSIFNLGTVLQDQGKLQEALPLLEQALVASKQLEPAHHWSAINIGNNLANLKSALNDLNGAEKMMRETLLMAADALGDDHRMVLMIKLNFSEILNKSKRHSEAEKIAQETLIKMQQILGGDHMFTLLMRDQLAISLAGQKRYGEAEAIQQQVIEKLAEVNLGKTPEMTQVISHLVDTLLLAGQLKQAEGHLETLIALQQQILGEDHPDTNASKQKLLDLRVQVN